MGYRYGRSDINETSMGISIWDVAYRYGIWYIDISFSPYRYGHSGYRYGIWANDMGDDRIDMVILDIDMAYLVTLACSQAHPYLALGELERGAQVAGDEEHQYAAQEQGLTLVTLSAQRKRYWWDQGYVGGV